MKMKRVLFFASVTLTYSLLAWGCCRTEPASFGVNMSGGEFGGVYPGELGVHYGYPAAADLDYFKEKGLTLIRFPFRWERLQPELYGELNERDLELMKAFVAAAKEREMPIFIDMHNFGRRSMDGGKTQTLIGEGPELTADHLADAWGKLAAAFKDDGLWGYDIMNEPHDMSANAPWFGIAQAVIDRIRTVDTRTPIVISGDSWSSGERWLQFSDTLRLLKDPANKLIFQCHQYFDHNSAGSYGKRNEEGVFLPSTYEFEGATPQTGVERIRPFVEWLRKHDLKGLVGEYGIPDDDPRWNVVLDNMLKYMQENNVSGTYWSAGPRWGKYRLAVQPYENYTVDRPQMEVLSKYGACRKAKAE